MKKLAFGFFISLCQCLSLTVSAQDSQELAPGYYLVVGAYAQSKQNIAQGYVNVLTQRGLKASYGYNSSRALYFVYLNYYSDLKSSLRGMMDARKQSGFADAWVRVVPGVIAGESKPAATTAAAPAPTTTPPSTPVSPAPSPTTEVTATSGTTDTKAEPAPAEDIVVTDNPEIVQHNPMTLGNTEVFMSLFQGTNNRIVDGKIKIIDTDRAKLLKELKGNEYLILPDPKSKSGQITLIAEVFGYRKVQREINYPMPLADTAKADIELMGTTFVINFDMVRYHRGDITTLYNVYFYNDAAIMQPESRYELNSLLEMMQEKPGFKIMLHGHTNGSYHGKILTLGDEKNFFSLTGAKEKTGSAKELSGERAETIRQYLITNGIDPNRIQTKAWGGKRPLYDKKSPNARKNVRVEVEILEE